MASKFQFRGFQNIETVSFVHLTKTMQSANHLLLQAGPPGVVAAAPLVAPSCSVEHLPIGPAATKVLAARGANPKGPEGAPVVALVFSQRHTVKAQPLTGSV